MEMERERERERERDRGREREREIEGRQHVDNLVRVSTKPVSSDQLCKG